MRGGWNKDVLGGKNRKINNRERHNSGLERSYVSRDFLRFIIITNISIIHFQAMAPAILYFHIFYYILILN